MAGREALSAYRKILKAAEKTFAGDVRMLKESVVEVRQKFEKNRNVTSDAEIQRLLDEANEVADIIANRFIQVKVGPNKYWYVGKKAKEHAGATLELPSEETNWKSG